MHVLEHITAAADQIILSDLLLHNNRRKLLWFQITDHLQQHHSRCNKFRWLDSRRLQLECLIIAIHKAEMVQRIEIGLNGFNVTGIATVSTNLFFLFIYLIQSIISQPHDMTKISCAAASPPVPSGAPASAKGAIVILLWSISRRCLKPS